MAFRPGRGEYDAAVKMGKVSSDAHEFTGSLYVSETIYAKNIQVDTVTNRVSLLEAGVISGSSDLEVGGELTVDGNLIVTGSVGIGVSDPDQALEVAGMVHISAESSTPDAPDDGDGGYLYAKTNGKVYWRSNEISEVDLTQGGGGGATVAGSDTQIQYNNGGSFGGATWLTYNDSNGYLGVGITGSAALSNRLTLPNSSSAAGQVLANAFVTYSSIRYKENVETISNPLELVSQLQGVKFTWKKDKTNDIGFIAEEVGKIIPEIVDWEENGIYARSVDYSRLTPVLIEAVKNQQKQISYLKEEIQSIKDGLKQS